MRSNVNDFIYFRTSLFQLFLPLDECRIYDLKALIQVYNNIIYFNNVVFQLVGNKYIFCFLQTGKLCFFCLPLYLFIYFANSFIFIYLFYFILDYISLTHLQEGAVTHYSVAFLYLLKTSENLKVF